MCATAKRKASTPTMRRRQAVECPHRSHMRQAGDSCILLAGVQLRSNFDVGQLDALNIDSVPVNAGDGLRPVHKHTVVVNDVHDGAQLASVRAVCNECHAANLDVAHAADRADTVRVRAIVPGFADRNAASEERIHRHRWRCATVRRRKPVIWQWPPREHPAPRLAAPN